MIPEDTYDDILKSLSRCNSDIIAMQQSNTRLFHDISSELLEIRNRIIKLKKEEEHNGK